MLKLLVKKKLDTNQLANVFVNSLFNVSENGFEVVSEMINDDPAFVTSPAIEKNKFDSFLMIVVVGNLRYLKENFEVAEAAEIRWLIIEKLARIYQMETREFEKIVNDYDSFVSRVNHPSKNTLYGMSKAIFHKLNLNDYQESYFKSMKTPNPLFLKRMDDVMANFLWDWEVFFKKYRLNLN